MDDPMYNDDGTDVLWGTDPDEDRAHVIPDLVVVRVTDDAVLVRGRGLSSDPFGLEDPNEEAWIPRSQIVGSRDCGISANAVGGEEGAIAITIWLAERRGLC